MPPSPPPPPHHHYHRLDNDRCITLTCFILTCQQCIAVLTQAHSASSIKGLETTLTGPPSKVPPRAAGLGRVQICLGKVCYFL